jgi:predicted membrane-bound mannosyltransferase
MNPELNLPLFLAAVALLQGLIAFWSFRASASAPTTLLVALLPVIGLPYQLWQLRARLFDNHIAGAITYLVLLVAAFGFYFFMPADETPWMLIHTMSVFGFLGVANLTATQLKP